MKINKTLLVNLKNKKTFCQLINLKNINIKSIGQDMDEIFTSVYIDKKTGEEIDSSSKNARKIVKMKTGMKVEYKETMSALKALDNLLKKTIDISGVNFVKSTIKGTSNIQNAKMHLRSKYFISIDLKDYFSQISFIQIKKWMENSLNISPDLAALIAEFTTLTMDEEGKRFLPQGFPTSPLLALLCSIDTFEKLNEIAKEYNLLFSIYVDDLTFSSKSYIPPHVTSMIVNTLRKNYLKINHNKIFVRRVSLNKQLVITGINFKSDKIFPFYKSDKYNAKNYIQKMDVLLGSIQKYAFTDMNIGILKILLEPCKNDRGSLFKKYLGYFQYVDEATKIVPLKYKSRRFRYWDQRRNYFKKQFDIISEINHITYKKSTRLNTQEIEEISNVCKKINKNLIKER